MATKTYTGAALDVEQIDTLNLALTWAAGDWIELKCNNKTVKVTAGTLTNTPELMAAAVHEALLASHHNTASFTADMTVDRGGQEYGEFQDIDAQVSGANVTIASSVPGVPYTITMTYGTAGDGTATYSAEVISASGKRYVDNASNYSGGTLPVAGDTVVVESGSLALSFGWSNLPDGINWKFRSGFLGSVGLPVTNTTWANYPYEEYRTRRAIIEPAVAGTLSVTTEGPGSYFYDHGSNATSGTNIMVRAGAVDIAGGDGLEILATGGSLNIGMDSTATSAEIKTLEVKKDAIVTTGANATHVDAADNVVITDGELTLGSSPNGASSTLKAYGGKLTCLESCSVYDFFIYSAYVDWRGAAIQSVTIYNSDGTFDATLCEQTTATEATELFSGANYFDPQNVMDVPIDFNGCRPNQANTLLAFNARITIGAAGAAAVVA